VAPGLPQGVLQLPGGSGATGTADLQEISSRPAYCETRRPQCSFHRCRRCGNFAMFTAIRRASAGCTPGASHKQQSRRTGKADGFAPNRLGGELQPCIPFMRRKRTKARPDRESISSARSTSSGLFVAAELTGDRLGPRRQHLSVSAPELALLAGSTVRILSH
jgi:hypothetical protein